jgi:hypothetical protein
LKRQHALEAIYLLRSINLLLVAAALVVFAAALTRLVPELAPRVAVLALVCLHPLFFQNAARVANDALGVATGIAGISLLVLADGRTLMTRGMLAAACIAASVWSKQTGLTLIPALVLGLPLIGRAHGVAGSRLWRATAVVCLALLVGLVPLWRWSYEHYGAIVTTQESLELATRGPVLNALLASVKSLPWKPLTETLFVPGRPWVGGWSFLSVQPTLAGVYGWYWRVMLAAALTGGIVAFVRRRKRTVTPAGDLRHDGDFSRLAVCAAVVFGTALGMLHHAVVSHAVFGRPMTNPWYFMAALPFLFVLVVRGLAALNGRVAVIASAALAALFVAIDLHGTWVQMPLAYANTADRALQWVRLTAVHPAMLSGNLRWLFLAIQLGALCLAIAGLFARKGNTTKRAIL